MRSANNWSKVKLYNNSYYFLAFFIIVVVMKRRERENERNEPQDKQMLHNDPWLSSLSSSSDRLLRQFPPVYLWSITFYYLEYFFGHF